MERKRPVKIVVAGEGGQGVQAVAEILAEAAYEDGAQALYIPAFGVEQRGGVSLAFLQISDRPVASPKFEKGDIVVALSGRAVRRTRQYVGPETVFIYDDLAEIKEEEMPRAARRILSIPAVAVAKAELHPRVFNIVIMGAVIGATRVVPVDQAKKALEKRLGYKFEQDPKLRELNHRALGRGVELVDGIL
jgi:2-oxoglutarate ferredoxin oxidoreductase subunit gamma